MPATVKTREMPEAFISVWGKLSVITKLCESAHVYTFIYNKNTTLKLLVQPGKQWLWDTILNQT